MVEVLAIIGWMPGLSILGILCQIISIFMPDGEYVDIGTIISVGLCAMLPFYAVPISAAATSRVVKKVKPKAMLVGVISLIASTVISALASIILMFWDRDYNGYTGHEYLFALLGILAIIGYVIGLTAEFRILNRATKVIKPQEINYKGYSRAQGYVRCPYCKEVVRENAEYCSNCGCRLDNS